MLLCGVGLKLIISVSNVKINQFSSLPTIMSLVLGTAQFGGCNYGSGVNQLSSLTIQEIHNILMSAYRLGVRRLDTAQGYGQAENVIGQFKKAYPGYSFRVGTKLSFPDLYITKDKCGNKGILTENGCKYMDKVFDKSLSNLRVSKLESVLLHSFQEFESTCVWDWLRKQAKDYRIHRIGVSVYHPWEIMKGIENPTLNHLQIPFNLFSVDSISRGTTITDLVYQKKKINSHFMIDVRSVFLQGLLVNLDYQVWKKIPDLTPQIFHNFVETLTRLKKDLNRSSFADLALAYVRHFKWIDGIILGCDSVQQLEDNVRLFKKSPLKESEVKIVQDSFKLLIFKVPLILDPSQWNHS